MTKWSEFQSPRAPVEKSTCRSKWRRQVAGLFLAQVVAHLDCERQHLGQRSSRRVLDQLGIDLAPVRGNQNAFLCHCRSGQPKCDDECSQEWIQHSRASYLT